MTHKRSLSQALLLAAVSATALGLAPSPAGPQSEFIGSWRLVSFEAWLSEGNVAYPQGQDALGMLTYAPDGSFSMIVARKERPRFATGDPLRGTDAEVRAAFEGSAAMSGTFQVDLQAGTVTHQIKVSTFPNFIGQTQKRFFNLSGNHLAMSTVPFTYQGVEPRAYWTWEKSSGPAQ